MLQSEFEARLAMIPAIIEGRVNTEYTVVQRELCKLIIEEAFALLEKVNSGKDGSL